MSLIKRIIDSVGFQKAKNAVVTTWRIKVKPAPQSPVVPPKQENISNQPIQYVMNDPSTPDLIKNMLPPVYTGKFPFNVKKYKGGGFSRLTVEGQAANCYVTITDTLNYCNSKSEKTFPRWPGTSNLTVIPLAGIDLNAYYDRATLRFFSYSDPRIGGSIFTCDSADIVSHELGHAILDTYRPETWSAILFEVEAFHEAYGDCTSLIHSLCYDEMINKALVQTYGDLSKPNVICQLAEQFGKAIYKLTGPDSGRSPDYLRSAINNFVYVDPKTLPKNAPANQLSAEPHSFSQIITGAFYEIFVMMFNDNVQNGKMTQLAAAKSARDTITKYLLKTIQNIPINAKFFQSFATTMLWSDVVLNSRKYHDRMHNIFVKRNLSPTVLKMMVEAPPCPENDLVLKTSSVSNIKLQDKIIRVQSNNPLYGVEVEIPNEQIYFYDQDRNFYDSIQITEEESYKGACDLIDYLHAQNKVSNTSETPFEIRDGKLIRTHIS